MSERVSGEFAADDGPSVEAVRPPLNFPSLDILRAVAAVSVVVYHVIELDGWSSFPSAMPLGWFRIGWMGVDLFFVISGFVITLSALQMIERLGPRGFRRPFARNRLARIVPLHYTTCGLFVVLVMPALVVEPDFLKQVVTHVLFVHNLSASTHGGINGPNWSLGAEMQFYLLVLLAAPLLAKVRWWLVLVTLIAISWLWRAYAFYAISADDGGKARFIWCSQLPGTLDEFGIGIALAMVAVAGRRRGMFDARNALWLGPVCLVLMWAVLRLFEQHPNYWESFVMVVTFRTALCILAGALVWLACCAAGPLWLRVSTPVRYLGRISYGIYLWHMLVILSLQRVPGLSHLQFLVLTLAFTLLLAAGSWHFLESPILQRVRRARTNSEAPRTRPSRATIGPDRKADSD